jgi:hypothetical protein
VGDNFTVVYTGPALNGGDEGALVIIRAQDGEITPADLAAVGSTGTTVGSEDTADQNVEVLGATSAVNDPADSAYEFIQVRVAVTTTNPGDTATFRLFEDDTNVGTLDASEARQSVSITTAGELAKIVVSPATQSTPQGIDSGAYTVTLQDSAGRTTQLVAGDSITINDAAPVEVTETGPDTAAAGDDTLTSDELVRGTDTFTAAPNGAAVGTYNITLTNTADPTITSTATLTVTAAAALTNDEVDIVTGADSWNGFGGGTFGGAATDVRVDQSTVRIDIDADASDANSTVRLNLTGTGVTFGGKATSSVTTVLDADGKGSLTITPDAGTIQAGDTIAISGAFSETLEFERAAVTDAVPASNPVFSTVGGSVDVTFTIVDQFGLPVTTGFVEAKRDGVNAAADATPQRKAVGADGKVTFTFTDTKATNGQTENVDLAYFIDQFTPSSSPDFTEGNATTIKYTTDGMGANFVVSLDATSTEGASYDASDVTVVPLADADADNDFGSDESTALTIAGGEPNATVTVSVDNGALILAPTEDELSEGSASVTATLNGAGALPAGYRIVGTKSGIVTVTTTAANRTETAQFTVTAETDTSTARNVAVSGPAEVESGTTQISFTAVVTDAFGNPVVGVPVSDLNVQVTGPAQFQDSDAVTNAAGELNLNVRVDAGAEGDVSIKVQGINDQFGAQADRLSAASVSDDAKGLPVSANVATATTTVKGAEVVDPAGIGLRLDGHGNGAADDKVTANAKNNAAGLTAVLYRAGKKIASHKLNSTGNYQFLVGDVNGKKATKYVVKVAATDTTQAGKAKTSVK